MRLRLDDGGNDDDNNQQEVEVSSSVRVAATGDDVPDDDISTDEVDEEDDSQPQSNQRDDDNDTSCHVSTHDDELGSMTWWDALTSRQQRAMMKKFMVSPPARATVPPPAVPVPATPIRNSKRKKLMIDDFHGRTDESVEAWLATVPQEVQRQLALDGSSWTSRELFYGVTAHLKDAASKWFTGISEEIGPDDRTLEFIAMRLRRNLTNIGFGKRVAAESFIEAFLNGLNNQVTVAQVRTVAPQTLEEAVQAAIDTCGEYGEGKKVTDWREAKRLYRAAGNLGENSSAVRNEERVREPAGQIDWVKLGLGFGGSDETPPTYDNTGKLVSGLAPSGKTTKDGVLPLAALQAIAVAAGIGQTAATQNEIIIVKIDTTGANVEFVSVGAATVRTGSAEATREAVKEIMGADVCCGRLYGFDIASGKRSPTVEAGALLLTDEEYPMIGPRKERMAQSPSNSSTVSGSDRVEAAVEMPVENSGQAWGKSDCEECITWGESVNQNECDAPTRQVPPPPPRIGSDARVGVDSEAGKPERAPATNQGVLGKRRCEREECATELRLAETEYGEERDAASTTLTKTKGAKSLPYGLLRRPLLMSGGRTVASRRRQRRTEQQLAVVHGVLAAELRERRKERAKVLRTVVLRVISRLAEPVNACPVNRRRRVAQRTVKNMKDATARAAAEHSALLQRLPVRTVCKTTGEMQPQSKRVLNDDEWLRQLEAYNTSASRWLTEEGSLTEMRLARRRALKEAKQFRVAKRARRLQQRQYAQERTPVDVVEGFGGGRVRVLGIWQFIGTTRYQQRIVVNALLVDGQGCEFLIGEDWMLEHQVKLDFAKRECNHVLRLLVDAEDGTTGVFLPKPSHKRQLMVAPTVNAVQNGMISVAVLNVEGKRETLPAPEALGTWVPTDDMMKLLRMNGELERTRVSEWVAKLKKEDAVPLYDESSMNIGEMEPEDRALVIALLRQTAEIVNKKDGCPPLATIHVQHHINTGDAAPIMLRRRRHAVAENELIDAKVDEMLAQGVIEEGQGAWGFPVVLVRKKDGTVRFCVDYRALNAVTIKYVYPLPRIDETLEALCGSTRFTSLDLHAGYWQLGVAARDKEKTAFTTRKGLFQFTRMPFGLCDAPSTFQRLMNCVLRGLTWISCLVYLDDIVIFTRGTVARHVVELAAVLERLAQAGLSLKASKCSFATTKMEYLGHDLTPDGIRPTARLVKAVKDFLVPTSDKEVRKFVALAGYYRRFMPDFGKRMAPLTMLLRENVSWRWKTEQEEAFAWAKAYLSKEPVLIYPNYSLPFKLTTDASKIGLGAVLSQDQANGDQPVAYASKVNSPAVSKYTISELECLAIVWAVQLFRPHLYGRHFTIVTDHIALKWLMTATEPAGRLHRWSLTLQEYDFSIQYRPGHENRVADALSRNPVEDDAVLAATAEDEVEIGIPSSTINGNPSEIDFVRKTCAPEPLIDEEVEKAVLQAIRTALAQRVEASELGIVQFTDADIKEEQSKSAMVQTLLQRGSYRGRQVFRKDDGLIYAETGVTEERIVLPAVFWALAFKEAHDGIWAGHLRGPQTYDRVGRMYWWPHMREAVHNWVSACQDCGSRKAKPKVAVPPLRSVRTGDVCDRWAIDVAGPLPQTIHGLVERFHRTWKDMVSLYINEEQDDWDDFVPCALYAYYSSPHATHGYQPNELMFGRKLRTSAELLRRSRLVHPRQSLEAYHEVLLKDLKTAQELAALAFRKSKPDKQSCVPLFVPLPYYYPNHLLEQMARDITMELREEAIAAADIDSEDDTPNQLGSQTGDTGGTVRPLAIDVSTDKRPASPLLNEPRTRGQRSSPFTSRSTEQTAATGKKRRAGTNRQDEDRGDEELDDAIASRQRPRSKRARIPSSPPDGEEHENVASRTRARLRQIPYREASNDAREGVARDEKTTQYY
ncbi:unnamed protein product [Phytophthora fragariaefolia]|uniref:Unnamed protein product n=1 Tax=Phytophthora fragariaefolia TaxID=1490495 RepID=A0A9W7D1J9_9STRA|nr:unnamed protein product [Phytophthora fragariaefolia]